MRAHQYHHLAEVLREHRERLEETTRKLAERGDPIGDLEADLLVDAGTARLLEVENALRHEAYLADRRFGVGRGAAPRRAAARVSSWTKPRIGRLRHYEPRPIRLPASYFETVAPSPAPTISLVTPSYGQGRFIDRTIHSVVSQGYPALEYHVQDGGSPDETMAVLARFDEVLTSWVSEPDAGQADAINRGFTRTSGEIMAWLNSDDLLLPGSLAYVAGYLAAHPDVDVVYGHRIMIDEDDGQIGAWILPAHDDRALTYADYVPQETLFWRRSIWEAAGGAVDPSFGYALDWDLLLRFREVGAKIVRLPRFLGAFRVHEEQKTTALDTVGASETALLRERVHGRPVPIEEVLDALRPYFARHILVHSWQRLVDRLPMRRALVLTRPPTALARTPAAGSLEAARPSGVESGPEPRRQDSAPSRR